MLILFVELVIPLDEHVFVLISRILFNSSYLTLTEVDVPIPTDWFGVTVKSIISLFDKLWAVDRDTCACILCNLPVNCSKLLFNEYSKLLTRRLNHEPIQYIEEFMPFYTVQLKVDERALIPRPETEYLIEIIKNKVVKPKSILDVGTGSGCISLMMKHLYPEAEVKGIDISPFAIQLATENATLNGMNIEFIQSDLLNEVSSSNFDLIIANLPYIPSSEIETLDLEVLNYEPLNALDGGDNDGINIIQNLINQIEDKKYKDFEIFLEIDERFGKKVIELLNNYDNVELIKDLADKDRYVYARR